MTTSIEWTDEVWGVAVGCSRVSAGCERCYAERVAHRGMSARHKGLTVVGASGPRWNGTVRFVPEVLSKPLFWRRPRRVFVNSMSDLFHEALADEQIDRVFAVIMASPRHTFQILTKRPKRMYEYLCGAEERVRAAAEALAAAYGWCHAHEDRPWPLDNAHVGVSVEDQASADARLPWLIDPDLPVAVRICSYEPALGPVDFTSIDILKQTYQPAHPHDPVVRLNALTGHVRGPDEMLEVRLDWIIVGGESGPGARAFSIEWARSVIEQGRAANVPVFVKQLGSKPCESIVDNEEENTLDHWRMTLTHRAGGDMSEWPAGLRVRMFPGDAYVEGPPTKPMRATARVTATGVEVTSE